MRDFTVQLIQALANEPGGVQINASKSGVKVSTRDTPLVSCKGADFDEAVEKCWNELMAAIDDMAKASPVFYSDTMNEKKQRLLNELPSVPTEQGRAMNNKEENTNELVMGLPDDSN